MYSDRKSRINLFVPESASNGLQSRTFLLWRCFDTNIIWSLKSGIKTRLKYAIYA